MRSRSDSRCLALLLVHPLACSAFASPAAWVSVGVVIGHLVSMLAYVRPLPLAGIAALRVLGRRHTFEVRRVAARSIPAQMIHLQVERNRSVRCLVHEPVRQLHPALVPDPSVFIRCGLRARPDPTSGFVNRDAIHDPLHNVTHAPPPSCARSSSSHSSATSSTWAGGGSGIGTVTRALYVTHGTNGGIAAHPPGVRSLRVDPTTSACPSMFTQIDNGIVTVRITPPLPRTALRVGPRRRTGRRRSGRTILRSTPKGRAT